VGRFLHPRLENQDSRHGFLINLSQNKKHDMRSQHAKKTIIEDFDEKFPA